MVGRGFCLAVIGHGHLQVDLHGLHHPASLEALSVGMTPSRARAQAADAPKDTGRLPKLQLRRLETLRGYRRCRAGPQTPTPPSVASVTRARERLRWCTDRRLERQTVRLPKRPERASARGIDAGWNIEPRDGRGMIHRPQEIPLHHYHLDQRVWGGARWNRTMDLSM